jgi:hypothetical protein
VGQLAPYEEEIVALIRAEAGEVLAAGRAALELSPSEGEQPAMCELRPADEAASPFAIQIDSAKQVTLHLGRYGTVCEIYDGARDELLDEIGEYLRAVLTGHYRESVRLGPDGELAKARGVLNIGDVEVRIFSSSLKTIGKRGPWQKLSYGAY